MYDHYCDQYVCQCIDHDWFWSPWSCWMVTETRLPGVTVAHSQRSGPVRGAPLTRRRGTSRSLSQQGDWCWWLSEGLVTRMFCSIAFSLWSSEVGGRRRFHRLQVFLYLFIIIGGIPFKSSIPHFLFPIISNNTVHHWESITSCIQAWSLIEGFLIKKNSV